MENLTKLQQIGFTEYEAKTYLALLKEHPATGYQISKISGVPRSMVYEVLGRLYAKGAVLETIEGRATYYRPLPPKLLLDQYQNDIQGLISKLRPELNGLYENNQDNRVWTILDRNAIFAYCKQMLQAAETEVYLVTNDHSFGFLKNFLDEILKKNITPNILYTGSQTISLGNVVYHPPLESESRD